MKIFFAALAAIAVQPFLFALRLVPVFLASPDPLYGIGLMLVAVVGVSAAAVLVLGIPAFLLLRKLDCVGWMSVGTAGLVSGALPVALMWPKKLQGYSSGQNWHGEYVDLYINGNPTYYAWATYGEDVLFFGLHGLVGALVFYAVWRRL
ncbi:hypothetical protein GM658_28135 [Pseudoduganella eburnea]|uniref:Uncharacterized protein n=1 Tax=Massilia eburnea TaxID=1776165 RepID=A0A6L6QQL9_9BURK|nr:hypothetical protein [Massilia eburnea]MTW14490.1 hypothetical protein [Massilia eburnea]